MDQNSQFRCREQFRQVLIEPFDVIDSRETELGVLLQSQVVCILAFSQNPVVARNASFGGSHIDELDQESKEQKANNLLDCCPLWGSVHWARHF